jgi:heptosyltransferase-1
LRTQSNFRLLVVRLGAMGDILHALPAVTALRIQHPEWGIDWVVEPRWRGLLTAENESEIPPIRQSAGEWMGHPGMKDEAANPPIRQSAGEWMGHPVGTGHPESVGRNAARPLVDRVYLAPAKEWGRRPLSGKTLSEIKALRAELKAGGYNAVLDFQGAVRSAAIGRMAGSGRLIGEARPREFAAKWLFNERVDAGGAHVIEQDMALAAAVAGDELKLVEPWLPVDAAAEGWADGIVPKANARPAALITPGAGWGAKRWPVERYAAVAAGLIDRGFHVLVNAGPGEESLAEFIASKTGGAAIAVNCSLDELIALTRRVRLCVAGDTGPLHLACALGCLVVGIYGPTDPNRNGPFGTRFRVLRSPESKRDHTRHAAPEAGMLTISPESVLKAADELVEEGRGR